MTRLGVAIDGARVLYRGLWPTYFTAPLGAAAIASRMMHLSEEQTAHALSLALMLSAGRSGRFHGALPGPVGDPGDGGGERHPCGGSREGRASAAILPCSMARGCAMRRASRQGLTH